MKTKLLQVQQYSKYLDKIATCEGNDIPMYYQKMALFLKANNEEYSKFFYTLYVGAIVAAVKQLKSKNVRLKELSENWSSSNVSQVGTLMKELCKNNNEYDAPKDSSAYKVVFAKVMNLIFDETDPCTQLYMCLIVYGSNEGRIFNKNAFGSIEKKLLASRTDDDVELALHSRELVMDDDRRSHFADVPNLSKPDVLFKRFNPKTMEEQDECYRALDEMALNKEINYDDYLYVKEILLNKGEKYFKDLKDKPAAAKTNGLNIQVIDGDEFLEEEELTDAER